MKKLAVDKIFLFSVIILVITGFFAFTSASLGLLAREGGASFSSVAFSQTFYGLFLGTIVCIIFSRIHYTFWRTYSFYIFLGSLFVTLLVFVPGLGLEHGGAKRWLMVGNFSFQPSEFLKIGYIIYLAAWLSSVKKKMDSVKYSVGPFLVISFLTGLVLLGQPDTDTFIVLLVAGMCMLFASGAKIRHMFIILIIATIGIGVVVYERPYVRDRILTFIQPNRDAHGSSYQIQQSLIAIGSGQLTGRGFGQSVQKFNYLPEPIGDSIFAVFSEEFGFLGGVALVAMFVFFTFRGVKIAIRAPDLFSGLVTLGIVILIVFQSFVNIAAMLGVLPLSGIPLLFVSHGGTALLMTLALVGIVLNVSKYQRSE